VEGEARLRQEGLEAESRAREAETRGRNEAMTAESIARDAAIVDAKTQLLAALEQQVED
jgi:hypothetical protein